MSGAAAGFDALLAERKGYPADIALGLIRRAIEQAIAAGMWRTEPAARVQAWGGIETVRFDPPGEARATLVHFHGGAYRIGAPEQVGAFAAALAARCSVTVICPRYRLAPEHPFPAAFRDGMAVLRAVRRAQETPLLLLSGDSAGGGLAASMALRLVEEAIPPDAVILLSPWLDLTVTSASYATNAATDPLFSRAAATEAAELYLQGMPADDARVSPLFGSVAGFPSTLINVGAGEVLIDDSRRFAATLTAAGVPVRLDVVAGMEHVAVTRGAALPGSEQTFAAVCEFIAWVAGTAARCRTPPSASPAAA